MTLEEFLKDAYERLMQTVALSEEFLANAPTTDTKAYIEGALFASNSLIEYIEDVAAEEKIKLTKLKI